MKGGKQQQRRSTTVPPEHVPNTSGPRSAVVVAAIAILAILAFANPQSYWEARKARQALESRAIIARDLLAAAVVRGATVHPAVEVRATADAGLGIAVSEPVPVGTILFSLPESLMLTPPPKAGVNASKDRGPALAVELARARFGGGEQSAWLTQYLTTLPAECPDNLATMKVEEVELVKTSLHSWKVKLFKDGLRAVRKAFPGLSSKDLQWTVCMVLSRALGRPSGGLALMPFVDLVNHGTTCHVNDRSDGSRVVVASRNMAAGEEVAFLYAESPSRARLLTSFGFTGDAPAASLVANDLPAYDAVFLAKHGCAGPVRISLDLERDGRLLPSTMLKVLRCVRLRKYTPAEAALAIETGRLEQPWADLPAEPLGMLKTDLSIVTSTLNSCGSAIDGKQMSRQVDLVRSLKKGRSVIGQAVSDETVALMGCYNFLAEAHKVLLPLAK